MHFLLPNKTTSAICFIYLDRKVTYLYHTTSTLSPSFCLFFGRYRWNTGIKGIKRCLLPDYWEKTWLSQFKCMSLTLILGNCTQSCRFLQLFLNCEKKHDLMWRRERMGPAEKPPNPGALLGEHYLCTTFSGCKFSCQFLGTLFNLRCLIRSTVMGKTTAY